MGLDESFRHRELISKKPRARKVRTPAGVEFFGVPIGTPITPGIKARAIEWHGKAKTEKMIVQERDAKATGRPRGSGRTPQERALAERKRYEKQQAKKRDKGTPPERGKHQNRGGPGYPGN